ncbi:MAG TPA: DNA recombination protein RmuC [Stellaceae bacterium]|nr:DNA recombination protein RmuC [Stellaceae bacterium]
MDLFLTLGFVVLAAGASVAITTLWLRRRDSQAEADYAASESRVQAAIRDRDMAVEARVAAERGAAAAQAELTAIQTRLADFERLRKEMTDAAKGAVTETAAQISSKLLDDHKRESSEAKQQTEERVRKVSETLLKQLAEVAQLVAVLDDRVNKTGGEMELLMRAVTSPGGAGQLAEIGLANTLQSFGLEVGRDFLLQQTTVDEEGRRLRPDAIVFLPTDTVLVIDCKASKFMLEIAKHEGTNQEAAAYEGLARTMNQHLRALSEKDYRNAVYAACKQAGFGGDDPHIISLMYLPNEAALERLRRADAEFFQRAREAQIIPAGPAGLHSALLMASTEIRRLRQMENQQEIVDKTRAVLESLAVVLGHAARTGAGLKNAVDNFMKFTGSINQRLLPRVRGLARLGVEPPKALPQSLPSFAVQTAEDSTLIEVEPTEPAPEPELQLPPRLVAE